ncbi:hypothetical protein NM208_g6595 [Fusarium decemcellulare]|uniref:Uncharacterized protein n=2 Tax=Fusarium decemcellulare TaxID=57161 RepID=A0ACC1SCT4_9HYPO|nr:hypothetical protein NM208_g6595 [Fusarium decemcellulare]
MQRSFVRNLRSAYNFQEAVLMQAQLLNVVAGWNPPVLFRGLTSHGLLVISVSSYNRHSPYSSRGALAMAKYCVWAISMALLVALAHTQETPDQHPLPAEAEILPVRQACNSACKQISLDDIIPSLDSKGDVKCCPPGTFFNGTSCVFKPTTVCPPNTKLQAGACVSDEKPVCPAGAVLHEEKCVSPTEPSCLSGTRFDGDSCISTQLPSCDAGFKFNGVSCISTERQVCPEGYTVSHLGTMRFNLSAILLALAAGSAVARNLPVEKRSLITELGGVVKGLEDGLGVTAIEGQLDALLGGSLSKLEGALGVTFAEKLLGLSDAGASPGTIQAIGEAVGMLLEGVGVNQVNAFLDAATGGAVSSLSEVLGVTDIEKALGIIPS